MAGKLVVVSGATLHCGAGTSSSTLAATSESTVALLGGLEVASVNDHEPGTNIKPFGNCKIKQKKYGHVTPCGSPETPDPWAPGETDILTPSGGPLIAQGAHLKCKHGGIIVVTSPGQSYLTVEGAGTLEDLLLALGIGSFGSIGFDDLLQGLADGFAFDSPEKLLEEAKKFLAGDDKAGERLLSRMGKGFETLSYLWSFRDALKSASHGDIKGFITNASGAAAGIEVSGGCMTLTMPEEGASGAGIPLIPITAAGCGALGSAAESVTKKVVKPLVDLGGDVVDGAEDIFNDTF